MAQLPRWPGAAGLSGVKLIVSDHHAGLKAARRAVFPSVPWQRCQFHLQQNAQAYVTWLDQRLAVGQRLRAIFNAPDRADAERLLHQAIEQWRREAPKLAAWAEENLAEGSTVFGYPPSHRTRLRTTNGLERINRELKRRTRVASIFPNPASCLRLVSAVYSTPFGHLIHGHSAGAVGAKRRWFLQGTDILPERSIAPAANPRVWVSFALRYRVTPKC